MESHAAVSLLERIERVPFDTAPEPKAVIPFCDHSIHLKITNEAVLATGRHGGGDLLMLVDAHTAGQLHSIGDLHERAAQVLVFGEAPQAWSNDSHVASVSPEGLLQPGDAHGVLKVKRAAPNAHKVPQDRPGAELRAQVMSDGPDVGSLAALDLQGSDGGLP